MKIDIFARVWSNNKGSSFMITIPKELIKMGYLKPDETAHLTIEIDPEEVKPLNNEVEQ